ncbi:MAG: hypothetical protein ACXITV_04745 [Luteibaculaceae bacterium]
MDTRKKNSYIKGGLLAWVALVLFACSPKVEPDVNPAFYLPTFPYHAMVSSVSEQQIELLIWQPVEKDYPARDAVGYYQKGFNAWAIDSIKPTFGAIRSGFEMFNRKAASIFLTAEPTDTQKPTLIFFPGWARLNAANYNIWFSFLAKKGYTVIAVNIPEYHEAVLTKESGLVGFNKNMLQEVKESSGPILQKMQEAESFQQQLTQFNALQNTAIINHAAFWLDKAFALVDSIKQTDTEIALMGHGFGGSVALSLGSAMGIKKVISIDGMQLMPMETDGFKPEILYFSTGEDANFNAQYWDAMQVNYRLVQPIKTRHYAFTDFIFWPAEKFTRGAKVALTGRAKPGELYKLVDTELENFLRE